MLAREPWWTCLSCIPPPNDGAEADASLPANRSPPFYNNMGRLGMRALGARGVQAGGVLNSPRTGAGSAVDCEHEPRPHAATRRAGVGRTAPPSRRNRRAATCSCWLTNATPRSVRCCTLHPGVDDVHISRVGEHVGGMQVICSNHGDNPDVGAPIPVRFAQGASLPHFTAPDNLLKVNRISVERLAIRLRCTI